MIEAIDLFSHSSSAVFAGTEPLVLELPYLSFPATRTSILHSRSFFFPPLGSLRLTWFAARR